MRGIFDILLLAFCSLCIGCICPGHGRFLLETGHPPGGNRKQHSFHNSMRCPLRHKTIHRIPWLEPIIISLAVSLILMWIVSKMTYKPEQSTPKLIMKGAAND